MKTLMTLCLLTIFTILGSYSYAMPEKVCVKDSKVGNSQKMRLRAHVYYLDSNGVSHSKWDIHGKGYEEVSINETAYCMKTSVLVDLFNSSNDFDPEGPEGYSFTSVRVDIKGKKDCHLSGNQAKHTSIGAARTGKVTFKYKIKETNWGAISFQTMLGCEEVS